MQPSNRGPGGPAVAVAAVRCAALLLSTLMLNACAEGDDTRATSTPPSEELPSASSLSQGTTAPVEEESRPVCPNPHGGSCLGELDAGTYRTEVFSPRITYAVPSGWMNMEDLPGNFLLLPPGRELDGVDAGTADYLGIYNGVTVAAADCAPEAMTGVGLKPRRIVAALARRDGLDVTAPRKVEIGGHPGLVVDIELQPGTKAGCDVEEDLTIVPLFIGAGPASVEHAQIPGLRTRLIVLDNRGSNIMIEVSDVQADDAARFPYEQVVRGLRIDN